MAGFMGAAGAMAMRGGAKMMGSSAAKSQAGSILASKDMDSLKKIVSEIKVSNSQLKNIEKHTKKSAGFMALYSPALKQQFTILGKSFGLLLRPIGDILARVIAPMARIVIKFALKMYKVWTNLDLFKGSADKDDKLKQLIVERRNADQRGETDVVKQLDEQINRLTRNELQKRIEDQEKFGIRLSEIQLVAIEENLRNESVYWNEAMDIRKDYHGTSLLDEKQAKIDLLNTGQSIIDGKKSQETTYQNDTKKSTEDFYTGEGGLATIHSTGMTKVKEMIKSTYKDIQTSLWVIMNQNATSYGPRAAISETKKFENMHPQYNIASTFNVKATINDESDVAILAQKLAEHQQTSLRRQGSWQ